MLNSVDTYEIRGCDMMKRNRFINENNMGLLRELVHNTRSLDESYSPMLEILEKVLDGSLKLPFYTPEYLVTMNSTVRVSNGLTFVPKNASTRCTPIITTANCR